MEESGLMGADSATRRLIKRALAPVLNETTYGWAHAISIARDIRAGRYTEPELELVTMALQPGDTALDLGANLGMYLPALSRAVGASGKVYAFEPIPYTGATLAKVIKLLRLRNVELVQMGCGEHSERTSFEVPVQASGALMTGQAHLARRDDDHAGKETQVRWARTTSFPAEVVSLNSYLADVRDVALIKADIEGGELPAFRGASEIIERDWPTVICEINPWFLEGFGINLGDLLRFFAHRGYDLYRYLDEHLRLVPVAEPGGIVEDNYVFVHPSRRDRFEPVLDTIDPAAQLRVK